MSGRGCAALPRIFFAEQLSPDVVDGVGLVLDGFEGAPVAVQHLADLLEALSGRNLWRDVLLAELEEDIDVVAWDGRQA
jgi:hypothetical protein